MIRSDLCKYYKCLHYADLLIYFSQVNCSLNQNNINSRKAVNRMQGWRLSFMTE